jgi:hypothetical protein
MVSPRLVLTLVIRKIFLPGMPTKFVHILHHLFTKPEKSQFNRLQLLKFDSIVSNANGHGVIAMHWDPWLWMSHVVEDITKNNAHLAVVV